MNDYDMAICISTIFEQLEAAVEDYIFEVSLSAVERIKEICAGLSPDAEEPILHFDRALNTLTIELQDYVFTGDQYDLSAMIALADSFSIESLTDGTVSLQLYIRSACILRKE